MPENDGLWTFRRLSGRKAGVSGGLRGGGVAEAGGGLSPRRSENGDGMHRGSVRGCQLRGGGELENEEDGGGTARGVA